MNVSEFLQNIQQKDNVFQNISRRELIKHSFENGDAIQTSNGALATWTPPESTGRAPKDTYIVDHESCKGTIDWSFEANNPLDPKTFDMLLEDAMGVLDEKEKIYVLDRVIGADAHYTLPVKLITDRALSALFIDNMFRAVPENIKDSLFTGSEYTLFALPYDKIQSDKYKGLLRDVNGKASDMILAMDMERKIGLVYGSRYCGSMKKLMFTVHNYLLPEKGILPLHCSANEGEEKDIALFLGLSGTGKTTLSSDPKRALLGDDEHGWSDNGIANFENGCYAKLINLNKEKEPEIHDATFHDADYLDHGAILENAMVYPNGVVDVDDDRFTENSRVSYPLSFLDNIKESSMGGHPKNIIFLTADATGVLPPVAKLNRDQAKLWFLMGYTSKLAGTETGITEPKTAFSRFFGGPFMPRNPGDYTLLFGEKIEKYNTQVYLVNTGWSGGAYGEGERMDIMVTRSIIDAALNGSLENVEYKEDPLFHILVPQSCPNVESSILNPKNTWEDKEAFDAQAKKLAEAFSAYFDKSFAETNVSEAVRAQCPGK